MAHILVVDDRPSNFDLLETVLGYYGHTVELATDGAQALERMEKVRPDLVITDLIMPNVDGLDLCERMRHTPSLADVPIIIHTASYRSNDARRIAESLGVRWVLPKPSDPSEIIAMVSQALGVDAGVPTPSVAHADAQAQSARPPAPGSQPHTPQAFHERMTRLLSDALELAHAQSRMLGDPQRGEAAMAHQLETLVRVAVRMSRERDPVALLDMFCDAMQNMLGTRYAGVAIVAPPHEARHFAARGLDAAAMTEVARDMGSCAAAMHVLGERSTNRMLVAARETDFMGLPPAHPPVHNLLACAITTRDDACGWIYVADHLGPGGFDAHDERLLSALGALLGTVWSSLSALDDLDRRVAQRTRELEAANTELEAFSMLVSHDLRSPLGSIDGFSLALREKFGAMLPPDGVRYLERIASNVEAMTRLIDDLLQFARLSRQPLVLQTVSLDALAEECVRRHREEIDSRGLTLMIGSLPTCRGDGALLSQVLFNLFGNAVKYTRRQPHPVIEMGANSFAGEHVIFVRDNGAGFDAAYAARLFRPFSRLHSATEFEGSGVGLALVKQVILRHGGRVWAESQPGRGACFTFTLPTTERRVSQS